MVALCRPRCSNICPFQVGVWFEHSSYCSRPWAQPPRRTRFAYSLSLGAKASSAAASSLGSPGALSARSEQNDTKKIGCFTNACSHTPPTKYSNSSCPGTA
eukprot:3584270-Alexandrium_andersonii.AAC.1